MFGEVGIKNEERKKFKKVVDCGKKLQLDERRY